MYMCIPHYMKTFVQTKQAAGKNKQGIKHR